MTRTVDAPCLPRLLARVALVGASLCGPVAAVAVAEERESRTVEFTTHEGTDFSVRPSPADGSLLIDLQGSLWSVPAAGGVAHRLTPDLLEAMRPSWAPDGRWIVAQAYVDGLWHLWRISADGRERRALTSGPHDDTSPVWSPDGSKVAFLSTRGGRPGVWILEPGTGLLRELGRGSFAAPQSPSWEPGGDALVLADAGVLKRVTLDGHVDTVTATCARGAPTAPARSPDGARLAYVCAGPQVGRLMLRDADGTSRPLGASDDVFPFAPAWLDDGSLIYGANGRIRRIDVGGGQERDVPFAATFRLQRGGYARKKYDFDDNSSRPVKGIVAPALAPDGRRLVFKALNDLWLSDLRGRTERLTNDAAYETEAVWSPDGRSLAYASDAEGLMQLYVLDVASRERRRVIRSSQAAVAPAWSPDGRQLAFQVETGETRVLDLASGEHRPLVPKLDYPGRPSWSADGRTLAFTALDEARNRILLVDVATGAQRWVDPAPLRSVSTRGDDGPVWSPDGRWLAFTMMSRLWVLPVTADGTPTGPAVPLSSGASDAPSWAADSRTLLYLANGRLRVVDRVTRRTRTIALDLEWREAHHAGEVLVHAGRLWDGARAEVRTDVDILVRDHRIVSIAPHSAHPPHVHVIDASGHMVTPGLFEMHNHQELRAKYLGDRQGRMWLAYGITSTRSTGDPVYRALEDRESLASGARIGPRFFMTGEMLEGSRPRWSFSRPVEDESQLALELSRAEALGYDLLKTYMRFRSDWQVDVAGFGHRRLGISTTSHFVFPGIAHGVDGGEHFVGPTRWSMGFPHLFRGNVYDDVFQAMQRSGFEVTTTNFAGRYELTELPGLLDDRRLRTLYPPWELDSLRRFVGCAAQTGPCDFFLAPHAEQSRLTAEDLVRVARGGGTVLVGSDAPLDSLVVSTFQNLYTLQKHGFTPFEALQAATLKAARAQGVERDLGSVEAGKLADLAVVEGRPDKDVRDLMRVRGVMKAGRWYTVDELLGPYSAPASP